MLDNNIVFNKIYDFLRLVVHKHQFNNNKLIMTKKILFS